MSKIDPNSRSTQEILGTLREEYYEIKPKGCWDFFEKRTKSPSLPYLRKRFGMSFNEILIKAGVPRDDLYSPKSKESRNKEHYLLELKELAKKLGHTPSAVEYQENGYALFILTDIFQTYNKAIKEAGLTPNIEPGSKKNISKKELIKEYKEISQKVGRPATYKEISLYSAKYIEFDFARAFGSINQLRQEAGFKGYETERKKKYTKEVIVELLISEYKNKQRHLTVREIKANKNLPSYTAILTCFKTTSLSSVWAEIDHILAKRQLESNGIKQNQMEMSKKKKAGDRGEQKVAHFLSFLNQSNYKVYNDIHLRVDGLVQQIDHLVVGINGIFHLETKYYKGDISIDKHGNWVQTNGGTQMTIEDPEGQICRHEEVLSRILMNEYDFTSILVHAHPKCSLNHMERTALTVKKAEQVFSFITTYKNEKNPDLHLTRDIISKICTKIESHIVQNHETAI